MRKGVIRWIADATILVGGGALVLSGVTKALDLNAFARTIASHGMVPEEFARAAAVGVCLVELVCGAAAVASLPARGQWSRGSAIVLAGVFAAFGAYAAVLDVRPPPKPTSCGCLFGGGRVADWSRVALQNAAATVLIVFAASRKHINSRSVASAVPDAPSG